MGYRVHAFSPDRDTPTGQVADREVTAAYEDLDALRAFARGVQVVTFEFENVPAASVEAIAELVPVRPSGFVLHTAGLSQRWTETGAFPVVGLHDGSSFIAWATVLGFLMVYVRTREEVLGRLGMATCMFSSAQRLRKRST